MNCGEWTHSGALPQTGFIHIMGMGANSTLGTLSPTFQVYGSHRAPSPVVAKGLNEWGSKIVVAQLGDLTVADAAAVHQLRAHFGQDNLCGESITQRRAAACSGSADFFTLAESKASALQAQVRER